MSNNIKRYILNVMVTVAVISASFTVFAMKNRYLSSSGADVEERVYYIFNNRLCNENLYNVGQDEINELRSWAKERPEAEKFVSLITQENTREYSPSSEVVEIKFRFLNGERLLDENNRLVNKDQIRELGEYAKEILYEDEAQGERVVFERTKEISKRGERCSELDRWSIEDRFLRPKGPKRPMRMRRFRIPKEPRKIKKPRRRKKGQGGFSFCKCIWNTLLFGASLCSADAGDSVGTLSERY